MTSRIAALAVDAVDVDTLVRFWTAVLGWTAVDSDPDDGAVTIGPARDRPGIIFCPVPEPHTGKNRLHLDLRADDTTTEDELARLFALGARRADVGQGDESRWTVLADPEGNEFCLLHRTVAQAAADGVA